MIMIKINKAVFASSFPATPSKANEIPPTSPTELPIASLAELSCLLFKEIVKTETTMLATYTSKNNIKERPYFVFVFVVFVVFIVFFVFVKYQEL